MKALTDYELWSGTRMRNPVLIMGPIIHPQAKHLIYAYLPPCFPSQGFFLVV